MARRPPPPSSPPATTARVLLWLSFADPTTPIYPAHEPLLPPSWKNLLADRSFPIPLPSSRPSSLSDTQVSSLFPFLFPSCFVCVRERACLGGHVGPRRVYSRVYRRLSRANSHNRYEINFDRDETLCFLATTKKFLNARVFVIIK